MKQYFYAENDKQCGPFTIDELKTKRLKKLTLVWTEGMANWITAEQVEELKAILVSEPPPLPKKDLPAQSPIVNIVTKAPSNVNINKGDYYKKETDAAVVGVILFLLPLVLNVAGIFNIENEESYNQLRVFAGIGAIGVRIFAINWVVKISKRQNRNSESWGIFAFFLPSISLISIGLLNKLKLKIELDSSLSTNEQANILVDKAKGLYKDNNKAESLELLNKSIELDENNLEAIKCRGFLNYELKNFENANKDFLFIKKKSDKVTIADYYLGNIQFVSNNLDTAVRLWQIAANEGIEEANIDLDRYWNFRGKYILSVDEIYRKIGLKIGFEWYGVNFFSYELKYKSGIERFVNIINLNKVKVVMYGNDFGVLIEIKEMSNKYLFGISHIEINDLNYDKVEKTLSIKALNEFTLDLIYDIEKYGKRDLLLFYEAFNRATNKNFELI